MDKECFMYVEQIGNLYIYDVLLSYIYPRVFVCEDEYECKYLFYEMASSDNEDAWLVTKVKKSVYYDLVDKKMTLQDAFNKTRKQDQFEIKKIYGNKHDVIEMGVDIDHWIKKLPSKPVYAEKKTKGVY